MSMHIAVVGAGIGGLAAACLLEKAGQKVTLFEAFQKPQPLGSGLLLQPTGQHILDRLGLLASIKTRSSVIDRLSGFAKGRKTFTLDVAYGDIDPSLYGLGVHRADLFEALWQLCQAGDISLALGFRATAVKNQHLVSEDQQHAGPFDLIIDFSGMRSTLRDAYAPVRRKQPYPFAALWSTVTYDPEQFSANTLTQRYERAQKMCGILPIGKTDEGPRAAFFWSLPRADYADWRQQHLNTWKDEVSALWPEMVDILKQFTSHKDLAFAPYSDVVLNKFYNKRLIFAGDAAHATSPQLGQGANLALLDAYTLASLVHQGLRAEDIGPAFDKDRRKHVFFYQWASRWLTPFFQSHSRLTSILRLLTCDLTCRVSFTRKIAAEVLAGYKTGPFGTLKL